MAAGKGRGVSSRGNSASEVSARCLSQTPKLLWKRPPARKPDARKNVSEGRDMADVLREMIAQCSGKFLKLSAETELVPVTRCLI